MKKSITLLIIIAFISIIAESCNRGANTFDPYASSAESISVDAALVDTTMLLDTGAVVSNEVIDQSGWTYEVTEDKMTSAKTYFARVEANELLIFNSPYDGGSVATLTIRKKRGSTNVYLKVSKGQFNTATDGGTINTRFDKTPARVYSYSNASSGSSDIIFIGSEAGFISKLKKHKTLLLEAEFYSEGIHQMEFNIDGLKWTH